MTNQVTELATALKLTSIPVEERNLAPYASDASFLTLGRPALAIFPRTEAEVLTVVGLAAKLGVKLTMRAKGSSTAGASLAPEGGVVLVTDRLGVVNKFGSRLGGWELKLVTAKGVEVPVAELEQHRTDEMYARVGAALSTEELDKRLAPLDWQTAVVPSSGWSTIGGNFATNAGGNGTPKYGTFNNVIGHLRMVVAKAGGAEVVEVTDRDKIRKMGGGQGLYGVITELDVRVVPKLTKDELFSAFCTCQVADVEALGDEVGNFMVAMEEVTKPTIAEFMMADRNLFKADDPVLRHPELADVFQYPDGAYKFVMMYQGRRDEMEKLPEVAKRFPGIVYKETSPATFKLLLELRKASTGKSPGRVAIPGFEDIYIEDPRFLGKVLKTIYGITEGSLPGRPVGHQYTGGLVVHYRPLAKLTKDEYGTAWDLTQKLTDSVCTPALHTVKRREHGLGLEVYKLSSPADRETMRTLKAEFDPLNVFSPHLMTETPDIHFAGQHFEGYQQRRAG